MKSTSNKYYKYKSKYLKTKIGGFNYNNILILHQITGNPREFDQIINKIKINNNVYEHHFETKSLDDFKFSKISKKLYNKYKHLSKLLIICIEHSSPIGLYFVNKYPEICSSIICYPLRLYSKESLDRRIWKYKDQGGWNKYISDKYDVDNYYLNINDSRFNELVNDNSDKAKEIIFLLFDKYLQLQHNKIPYKYKIPTYLFSRLDMDIDSIVKLNYERKEIADMKGIVTENDALYNSMMWNFHRVKLDKEIIDKNTDNLVTIHYVIGGIQNDNVILDAISILNKK